MSTSATAIASRNGYQRLRAFFGGFRVAYLPILATYFAFGASAITGIATLTNPCNPSLNSYLTE